LAVLLQWTQAHTIIIGGSEIYALITRRLIAHLSLIIEVARRHAIRKAPRQTHFREVSTKIIIPWHIPHCICSSIRRNLLLLKHYRLSALLLANLKLMQLSLQGQLQLVQLSDLSDEVFIRNWVVWWLWLLVSFVVILKCCLLSWRGSLTSRHRFVILLGSKWQRAAVAWGLRVTLVRRVACIHLGLALNRVSD
jgi:hypothetical protein